MAYQDFPADLRRLSPRPTIFGAGGDSLVGINTWQLPSGAQIYIEEAEGDYVLDKHSVQAPYGNLVVAPLSGPGRWLLKDQLMLQERNYDSFGRIRVSQPTTIFEAKTLYDKDPLRFVENLINGATSVYQAQRSSTFLSVDGSSGSRATRQTKRYLNYQSGKGQKVGATYVMHGGAEAGIVKRVGYFDDNNGIFVQVDGSGPSLVVRSDLTGSPVDTVVPQSEWNMDRMDGAGASGVTLQAHAAQIFVVDFQWLGVGRVRVGFDIDGQLDYAHQFLHANSTANVFMRSPNLPVRWEILNSSPGPTSTLEAICAEVSTEGGTSPSGLIHAADMGVTGRSVTTTLVPLLSIRLKASHNRASVFPQLISLLEVGNQTSQWIAQLNPSITGGAAPSWVDVPNSAVQYDVTRDGTLNEDGYRIASGYMSKDASAAVGNGLDSQLVLASDYAGTADELVIGARTFSASETIAAAVRWLEQL